MLLTELWIADLASEMFDNLAAWGHSPDAGPLFDDAMS